MTKTAKVLDITRRQLQNKIMNMRYKNKSGQFFSMVGGKKLPTFVINLEMKCKHLQLYYRKQSP